jgi:sporulation protein YlmC with PRC-barrel domain
MDIPINAKVYCQDELYGHTQAVILNPANDVITHVVVKENKSPHIERLVPIYMIDASLANTIHLKLNETMTQSLPLFFDEEYIQTTVPHYMHISDMLSIEPVVIPEKKFIKERIYHIPSNELAVYRGAHVCSANGDAIGIIDEFLIDQNEGHVTHLILREGHIFGKKDVFIPVSEIESFDESRLQLKLNKENIEALPTIPARSIRL